MECPFCEKLTRLNELPDDELVGHFRHSVALLGPWQYYTGYCVLVSRVHAAELFELGDDDRRGLLDDMTHLARAIAGAFRPRKMNYELLGNQVPHLHWHLFPRSETDPDHLQPVWVALERAGRDPNERARLTGTVNRHLVAAKIRDACKTEFMMDRATRAGGSSSMAKEDR
jgi:diadenosine tetraphosphate (Ap4A) HIT family hydrolase